MVAQPGWIKFQHFFNADRSLGLFIDKGDFNGANVSTLYGRRGDYGYRLSSTGVYIEAETEDLTEFTDGFGFNFNQAATGVFWQGKEGSTVHLSLYRDNTTQAIQVYRGDAGTLLGATPDGTAPVGVDLFIVITGEIHDTTGFVQIWINGTKYFDSADLNPGGVDTRNGGTSGLVNRHRWKNSSGGSQWYVNDIYCADPNASGYTMMHDWRCEQLLPTSDIIADFTPSAGGTVFGVVDDVPFSSADKATSSTPGDRARLGHANGGAVAGVIRSMSIVTQLAKDSGTAEATIGLYDGTNLEQAAAEVVLSTTASVHQLILTERPSGGGAWDATSRDATASDVENTT